jgi:signal peptidase I
MATPTTSELFPEDAPVAPPAKHASPSSARTAIEWIVVVAGAVLVALIIKTFVVQAFYIPSESMRPTLEIGDRVLVNKLSYHLHDVNRGDIIVFERPDGAADTEIKDLIKRVIALPGEKVILQDHKVYINDHLLNEPYLPPGTLTEANGTWTHSCRADDPCVVPPGTVWAMGDNRMNSKDSRYIGPIPEDKLVGRAFVIVWPVNRFGGM